MASRLATGFVLCAMMAAIPQIAAGRTVGITAAVNRSAVGTPPVGAVRTLSLGDNVIFNEKIDTDGVGLLQILLADGTSFTVGPNSSLVIDRFVYDPEAGKAEVAATLTKGVFRFIGAKTSKNPGGVTISSPVGTIGIRGAVVDISLSQAGSDSDVEAHIDMLFGDEITLTEASGTVQRVYEPGYSIIVRQTPSGNPVSGVQKTPPGTGTAIQQSLTGLPGTTGGAPESPTDETVTVSGIAQQNSTLSPVINNPPVPLARPTETDATVTVVEDAGRDVAVQDVTETIDTTLPPVNTRPVRILTATGTYVASGGSGETYTNPGALGLLGGSAGQDQSITLALSGDKGSGTLAQGVVTLPVYSDESFTAHTIAVSDGYTLDGEALSGKVYSGVDGFAAYVLAVDGDLTNPLFALTGTPLAELSVLQTGDVRTYSFTTDALQNTRIPFSRADALDVSEAGASVTDFFVIEPADGNGSVRLLQSSLLISGSGTAQVSQIGVNVGEFFGEGGVLVNEFGRRGSVRDSSTEIARTYFGGIKTQGGPAGGNQIFGSNGENLVLGNNSIANDNFNDSSGTFAAGLPLGTLHVLNLEEEQSVADFVTANGSGRQLGTVGTIRGFAAGIEQGVRDDGSGYVFNSSSTTPDDLTVEFDSGSNRFGAELTTRTSDTSLSIAVGMGIRGNSEYGAATYVDDDTFAATDNNSHTRTNLRDLNDDGSVEDEFFPLPGFSSNSYFVSGDLSPQSSLLAQGKLCECEFLEWGWWGTQINASRDPAATDAEVRSTVHLGTWVAGDVTANAELAPLAGTTGSFSGSAVGSVLTQVGDQSASYLASGDMDMTFDFGNRTGSMVVSDFDGRDFSGSLASGSGTDATFAGTLTETTAGNEAGGALSGAFVNDGNTIAQGVIGDFDLSSGSGDWSAVGVIGGARTQ